MAGCWQCDGWMDSICVFSPTHTHTHTQHKTRITKLGELIITSQKYRTQSQNTEDAIHKLEDMLKEASEVPKGPSDLTVARIQAL